MTRPPSPSPRALTIPGFTLGHGTDPKNLTGLTVILCPDGALAAAEVRGSATGTRQFDSLVSAQHVSSKAHAVVLAGGSGFGLSSADLVVKWLARHGYGFQTGVATVPIVPTAILFDLAFGNQVFPGPVLVDEAIVGAAQGPVEIGSVGAGTGATVGKANGGPANGMKGGFGFASLTVPGGPDRGRRRGRERLRRRPPARRHPPRRLPHRRRTPTSSPMPSASWPTCRPRRQAPGKGTPPWPW